MDAEEIEKYRYLGYSEKDRRASVGFRGIGKDSGLAIAEKIIVTTTKAGINRLFRVVINAKSMLDEVSATKNPPLDDLLEKHSFIEEEVEAKDTHYTFIELHKIKSDASVLFDERQIREYLSRICPLPFNNNFTHASDIERRLVENVPDYVSVPLQLNGVEVWKPFPINYTEPQYEVIFPSEEETAEPLAFCWYCGHAGKGQFDDKDNRGLVFRVKNFAIGDQHRTREALWHTAPERAFYFFGEIHVLDQNVVPSTDRTNFEDNDARVQLYDRCRRIAQVLSRRAYLESDERRLELKTQDAEESIQEKEHLIDDGRLSGSLKDDMQYEMRKVIDDIEERITRARSRRKPTSRTAVLVKSSQKVVSKGRKLLETLASDKPYYKAEEKVRLDAQSKEVYKIIVNCLREEFKGKLALLQRIIGRIDTALEHRFGVRR